MGKASFWIHTAAALSTLHMAVTMYKGPDPKCVKKRTIECVVQHPAAVSVFAVGSAFTAAQGSVSATAAAILIALLTVVLLRDEDEEGEQEE